MIACYDLARCPPTYDVVAFLGLLEVERLRRGEAYVDIHVLPGPYGGFRHERKSREELVAFRDRVLVPMCHMMPSARSVSVDADRSAEGWGRGEYWISLPAICRALRAGSRPLRARAPVATRPDLITLTLREASRYKLRNSQVEEWGRAARHLRDRGWRVVVVRDTARAHELVYGVPTDPAASVDLDARARLYASARLNVGISNGPMWMAIFMDSPVLMLRPTTSAQAGPYDDTFYARHGVPRGSQLPTSPPHQRLVWEDDDRNVIVDEIERMVRVGPTSVAGDH